jgi:hypothetical protein
VHAYVALSATSIESRFEARHETRLMPPVGRGRIGPADGVLAQKYGRPEARVVLPLRRGGHRQVAFVARPAGGDRCGIARTGDLQLRASHLSASPLAPVVQQLYRTSGLEPDQL